MATQSKEVTLDDGGRIAIEFNTGNKMLELVRYGKDKERIDFVKISMRKKGEAERSALMSAFITRNKFEGKIATQIFSQLSELKY